MGWGWGAGTRLGLEETAAAQIVGPTNFSLQHRTTAAPTVSVGQGEGGDRRWQVHGERIGSGLGKIMHFRLDMVSSGCLAGGVVRSVDWFQIPVPPFSSCVTLGECLRLFVPRFSHL